LLELSLCMLFFQWASHTVLLPLSASPVNKHIYTFVLQYVAMTVTQREHYSLNYAGTDTKERHDCSCVSAEQTVSTLCAVYTSYLQIYPAAYAQHTTCVHYIRPSSCCTCITYHLAISSPYACVLLELTIMSHIMNCLTTCI
jgi:hypothetical protein